MNYIETMKQALDALEWYVDEDDVIEGMEGNEPWIEGKRDAEKVIEDLRAAIAHGESEPTIKESKTVDHFLLNGTRFKMNFDGEGTVFCFRNYFQELHGKWVVLVAAEDDCHLKVPQMQPESEPVAYSVGNTLHWHTGKGLTNVQLYAAPQVADYVPLTDRQIYDCFVSSLGENGAESYEEMVATVEWPELTLVARAIERAVRGDAK